MRKLTIITSLLAFVFVVSTTVYAAPQPLVVSKKKPVVVHKTAVEKRVVPPKKVVPAKKKLPMKKVVTAKPVPAVSKKPCEVGGCNGTICGELGSNKFITTCEFKPQYACYKQAVCTRERLEGRDRCVWQFNDAFNACLENIKKQKAVL